MENISDISTEELRTLSQEINKELEFRQLEKRKTCEHLNWIRIMYMRPGAFYDGCENCQIPKREVFPEEFKTMTTTNIL